jgi:hypothetical protein
MQDPVFYGIVIATSLAFAVMIAGLVFLYKKANENKDKQ